MRKWIWLLLAVVLLAGCTQQAQETVPQTQPEPITSTLMIYMMGSDLEAKGGAGTNDLEEIAAAGVDLEHCNVLVFAGGCPYWHNETVGEDACSVLKLEENGFTKLQSVQPMSMATAETLSMFLNYGYSNYPADRYGLILWDHGSGPVMGYGREELHGKDALLLEEMTAALKDSPFGPENKLAWVGFDACLMASAELAATWADYADYMVSSQEVEPSIGWNYQFVSGMGCEDITQMLQTLTSGYLESCEAYFAERGYNGREATLSCVDLSKVSELEQSIEALFTKAGADVESSYDKFSALRAQTRAFGRASTGSEYDLVDLGDLADKLSALYPEEAAQLQTALEQAVIFNQNNTQQCSGLSIYYPFYNKDYFFKSIRGADSWQTTYRKLGTFPSYQSYLDGYQKIWNGTDRLDQFAASIQPSIVNNEYSLQLTQEQQNCYAGAVYYILQRESDALYTCVMVSSDVENKDGRLVANFDGKAIYVKDKYGKQTIPVSLELDRIGDKSYYSVFANLSSQLPGTYMTEEKYIGGEKREGNYRYHLLLDKPAGELSVSALLPIDQEAEDLVGGKLEDADLSQWGIAKFFQLGHKYLTRDDSGLILPYEQWQEQGTISYVEYYLPDGMEFVYEPLEGGEYYLMIETRDTQGSRYCSELLPIQVEGKERPAYVYPATDVQWGEGDRVLLTEQEDLALYMNMVEDMGKVRFVLELENRTDGNINLLAQDLICNDNYYCMSYYAFLTAVPGQNAWASTDQNMGLPEESGALEELESLMFRVEARDEVNGKLCLEPQIFRVMLSEQMREAFRQGYDKQEYREEPYLGALAGEQVLYRDENMVMTLLGMGAMETEYSDVLRAVIAVENLSQEPITTGVCGVALNDQYIFLSRGVKTVMPGRTELLCLEPTNSDLEAQKITQIHSAKILMRTVRDATFYSGFSTPIWCEVALSQKAPVPEPFQEEETVIYEKDGIRVAVGAWQEDYTNGYWPVSIYNGNQEGVYVRLVDGQVNGSSEIFCQFSNNAVGPEQYLRGKLRYSYEVTDLQEVSFQIQILDIFEERVIATDTERITLVP